MAVENKSWKDRVWEHLERYKRETLGIPGKGMRGDLEYGHILPAGTHYANYMCEQALRVTERIKKHPDWYYLTSSQTMCVNFFAPLVEGEDYRFLNMFLTLFGIKADIIKAEFEFTPKKHSTNFDFYCEGKDGTKYYFEIKYTEADIAKSGGGDNKEKQLDTYRRFYEEDVLENPIFRNSTPDLFMSRHYQAYRNMLMANEKDHSFFITMAGNVGTEDEFLSAMKDLNLGEGELKTVRLVHWEELLEQVIGLFSAKDRRGAYLYPRLLGYYREFARKYLLESK